MSKSEPHIKGQQLLGAVKLLRTRRAEALALLDARLHQYLDERIVVSAWYPEQDHFELLQVVSHFVRLTSKRDPWRIMGEDGARSDFNGPYATLLRKGNSDAMLSNVARAWPLYHDTGRIVVTLPAPNNARIELHDHARLLPEQFELSAGFYAEMLRLSGASDPKVSTLPYSQTGNVAVWLASWA